MINSSRIYASTNFALDRLFVALIGPLLLCSCTHFYAFDSNLSQRVEQWNNKQFYGRSISTLELVKPNHDKYTELQSLLTITKQLASRYETNTIANAQNLIERKHWQQALDLYNEGVSNLPNSQPMAQAKKDFHTKRQRRTDDLYFQLALLDSRSLPQRTSLIKEITGTDPTDKNAQKELNVSSHKTEKFTKMLLDKGQLALQENNNLLALEYLSLANVLSKNNETSSALEKVNTRLTSIEKEKQLTVNKKLDSIATNLLAEHNQYFDNQQYVKAKERLQVLQTYRERIPQISQLEMRLQQTIDKEIQSSIELGQKFYSQGQYDDAYQTWRVSLNLAPNDAALLSHIERVQRVLESLRRLNNSEQTLQFPSEQHSSE